MSEPLEPLAAKTKQPYRGLFAGRALRSGGDADSPLIVERFRELGAGIKEQITVRNYSSAPVECVVSFRVEVDFADLFEVKEPRGQRRRHRTGSPDVSAGGRATRRREYHAHCDAHC